MLDPGGLRHRTTWVNWSRTQQCCPLGVHYPDNEGELASLLAAASRAGETVRAVGAGHSWTDAVCTDGHIVSLDRMARVLAIDREQHLVTVEAGIRIRDLSAALQRAGLGLSIIGSISEQSIAGAISTGTHATGLRYGNLASRVVALRLMTPGGETLDLSSENRPDVLRAARISLGALGVITRVTLRCEPVFNLLERSEPIRFDDAVAQLDSRLSESEHVKLWWLPHTPRAWWSRYDRTTRSATPVNGIARWVDDHIVAPVVFPTLLRLGKLVPGLIPRFNRMVAGSRFRHVERVAWAPEVFNVGVVPRHDETEWAIPIERAAEGLQRLRELIERERLRVNFIVEARFAAADDAMLSPATGRDSCHLGAYMFRSKGWRRYFEGFEQLMMELGGRPHWGKAHRIEAGYLRSAYPEYDAFNAIRRELDPNGTMANAFVQRVFPLAT